MKRVVVGGKETSDVMMTKLLCERLVLFDCIWWDVENEKNVPFFDKDEQVGIEDILKGIFHITIRN